MRSLTTVNPSSFSATPKTCNSIVAQNADHAQLWSCTWWNQIEEEDRAQVIYAAWLRTGPTSMLPAMPEDSTEQSDTGVIVVGAGPTGLLLAGDLAAAGVPVALVERHEHGSELTRAFVVHARTLEQFDQRGVADALVSHGRPVETRASATPR